MNKNREPGNHLRSCRGGHRWTYWRDTDGRMVYEDGRARQVCSDCNMQKVNGTWRRPASYSISERP